MLWFFIYKFFMFGFKVWCMNLMLYYVIDGGKLIYEGNWDMGIVVDMFWLMDYFDVIVFGSGDGDFIDIVEVLQECGKWVEVIVFCEYIVQKFIDVVDCFIYLFDIEEGLMLVCYKLGVKDVVGEV